MMKFENPLSDGPIEAESATRQGATTSATGGTAKGRAFVQARFSDLGGVRKIFTTYKTAQYVVIEDISLAVIYRVIQLIVLIYAVMMLMYWHEYNVMHETKSTNNQYAAMNAFTGHTEEFCSGAGVSGSDYICAQGWEYQNNTCKDYKAGEVIRKAADKIDVMTYAQTVKQTKTDKWHENLFTPGRVEDVKVTVAHAFSVPDIDRPSQTATTTLFDHEGGVIESYEPDPDTGGLTITLPVKKWLELAGVNLDMPNTRAIRECSTDPGNPIWGPTRTPTFRMTGVQINIQFYTSNAHYGFLSMAGGEVYTHVTVELADLNWMSFGPQILHEYSADEYVDSYPYGVRMQVSASGHYGVFDFGKLISQLTTYLVLMTAGVFLTDLFTTALSSSKDVYKDAKLEFLNKSGVEAERFRRFNEFKAEYEHELDLMFKVYFNAKLVDTDGNGTFEYHLDTLEELLLHLGDDEMTDLRTHDMEAYNTKLDEIKKKIFRHDGNHAGAGFFLKEDFVAWYVQRTFGGKNPTKDFLKHIHGEIEEIQFSRQVVQDAMRVFEEIFRAQPTEVQEALKAQGKGPELPFAQLETVLFRLEDAEHHPKVEVGGKKVFALSDTNKHSDRNTFEGAIQEALVAINSKCPTTEQDKQTFSDDDFVAWWADRQKRIWDADVLLREGRGFVGMESVI